MTCDVIIYRDVAAHFVGWKQSVSLCIDVCFKLLPSECNTFYAIVFFFLTYYTMLRPLIPLCFYECNMDIVGSGGVSY